MKTIKLNAKPNPTMEDTFPNVGTVTDQTTNEAHENNYFRDHSEEQIREKYIKFTVFMDSLNSTLELTPSATVDIFVTRINDLMQRSHNIK